MKVGFTGTREGMTPEQESAVAYLVGRLWVDEAHHGDCIGADAQFHNIARLCSSAKVTTHPPNSSSMRAFCVATYTREPKPYLERNHAIVDEANVLIAAPKNETEQKRSGTWSTIRYARMQGKPIYIVYADGTIEKENIAIGATTPDSNRG